MSAFTPYKKLKNNEEVSVVTDLSLTKNKAEDIIPNALIRFPINLTSVILNLPSYQKQLFDFNYFQKEETKKEDKKQKNEKFLMKNILQSDEDVVKRDEVLLANKLNFDEHASRMETLVSNLGKSENGHRCIYCGKNYSRKYGLKIHIRTHTGYKPLKCKYCSRPFGDPSNLNKHVRLHAQGQTPYKCQFCGKILVRRRDLERHVKSRHHHHHQEENI